MNNLVKYMKYHLPDALFLAVDNEFFVDILMEFTLPLYSTYYPRIIKGITVTSKMAVKTINEANEVEGISKYVIPMRDEAYPYIGIATFAYSRNGGPGQYNGAGMPSPTQAMMSRVMSSLGTNDVSFTGNFEFPNIIEIDPPPGYHTDFTVSMKQCRKLVEVKAGYHEWFRELFECDCKVALYNKFYSVKGGGIFGGVDLKDYISDLEDYKNTRKDLIDKFAKDYFKDADRFSEIFNYSAGHEWT